jgi:hypothetical protein
MTKVLFGDAKGTRTVRKECSRSKASWARVAASCLFLTLLLGTVSAAYAQTSNSAGGATHAPSVAPPAAPQTAPPSPKLVHLPKAYAEGLLGQQVLDGKGNVIGAIVNVLINKRGVPKAAVVEFAGFLGVGNRDVAVEWNALRFSVNENGIAITVILDATKLKALPEYKPDATSVPVATQPPAPKAAP